MNTPRPDGYIIVSKVNIGPSPQTVGLATDHENLETGWEFPNDLFSPEELFIIFPTEEAARKKLEELKPIMGALETAGADIPSRRDLDVMPVFFHEDGPAKTGNWSFSSQNGDDNTTHIDGYVIKAIRESDGIGLIRGENSSWLEDNIVFVEGALVCNTEEEAQALARKIINNNSMMIGRPGHVFPESVHIRKIKGTLTKVGDQRHSILESEHIPVIRS